MILHTPFHHGVTYHINCHRQCSIIQDFGTHSLPVKISIKTNLFTCLAPFGFDLSSTKSFFDNSDSGADHRVRITWNFRSLCFGIASITSGWIIGDKLRLHIWSRGVEYALSIPKIFLNSLTKAKFRFIQVVHGMHNSENSLRNTGIIIFVDIGVPIVNTIIFIDTAVINAGITISIKQTQVVGSVIWIFLNGFSNLYVIRNALWRV